MSTFDELLDQLATRPVPPTPAELGDAVHERLNRLLVVHHVIDFVWRAVPYATWHFGQAVVGLMYLSLTGRFPPRRNT